MTPIRRRYHARSLQDGLRLPLLEKLHPGSSQSLPCPLCVSRHPEDPLALILPLACVLAGAFMPVLELVPFASAFLGLAVMLVAYAMLSRDGLFALLALVPIAAALWTGKTVIF